ncbi:3-hydroxyisobutyrate dehydrogenase [Methylobacterium phyllostachyos]|uniref:3-hydroxyisobutyrate dehydrogenase n=1 Tax=Methylobacterium phyllostachyos TaxID=582672 RepID=A0A1H0BI00_9HYPH|nr:NAD(P)-dependent oxidoreductase [Methylobacterium phyllostachyos]SDN45278.1 3-hydroxyisobutyrate dehydrogenase [Methylobacterium phyllostachyos]
MPTIAVIAPGAMGSAIGARLAEHGARVLTSLDGRGAASRARAASAGMVHAADADLAAADILLSIVPPADAEALARRLAPTLTASPKKPVYIDANAVSPETVGRIAEIVAATGAPFLDGAILGLPPKPGTKGPRVYVSGADTVPTLVLRDLGLDLRVCPGGIGAASSLKMSYAGLNKGLTALAAIMILAAERTGAGEALLAELAENEPSLLARFAKGLPDMAPKAYRWAPEMEEIADFLGPDAAGRQVFTGYAALYRHLAAEAGAADIAALIRFASDAATR